jgi:hypothetical protein
MKKFIRDQILGPVIRRVFTAGGTFLVAEGLIEPDQFNIVANALIPVVMYGIDLLHSNIAKKQGWK